jgi:3-phenylpropionate/trans-cinnamate dioxygenase ferredoxin reductase subunit
MEVPIAEIREVGSAAIAITFETPTGFDALPGQFVRVIVNVGGEVESRSYTISSPFVDDTFEITVDIDPQQGTVAPRLADFEQGDTVEMTGPYGNIHYENEDRAVVLAGGPGVGPAVGIAERAFADGNDAAVVYRDDTPIHEDRLTTLADGGAVVRILGRGDKLVDAVVDATAGNGQVFVYGFADFVADAVKALSKAGIDPDDAKVENFG